MTYLDDPIGRRGNVTADPVLTYTSKGHAMARLTIAWTPRIRDNPNGEFRNADTIYLPCVFWRDLAEHIAATVTKGARILVYGHLQDFETRRDGIRVTTKQLNCIDAAVSLRFATAAVTKSTRSNTGSNNTPF